MSADPRLDGRARSELALDLRVAISVDAYAVDAVSFCRGGSAWRACCGSRSPGRSAVISGQASSSEGRGLRRCSPKSVRSYSMSWDSASPQARAPVDVDVQDRGGRCARNGVRGLPGRSEAPSRSRARSEGAQAARRRPARAPVAGGASSTLPAPRRRVDWRSRRHPDRDRGSRSGRRNRAGRRPAAGLQTNVGGPASAADPAGPRSEPADTFASAPSEAYQNKTPKERAQLAAQRVQELVDFLGYHRRPGFFATCVGRTIRARSPGAAPSGSTSDRRRARPELVPLKDKLAGLAWKGEAVPSATRPSR